MNRLLTSPSLSNNVDSLQARAATPAIQSPSVDDFPLITPSSVAASEPRLDPLLAWNNPLRLQKGMLSAPEPEPVRLDQVVTPTQELAPAFSLDAVVGASLHPAPEYQPILGSMDVSQPPPSRNLRTSVGLKLPSFDLLGIANPRPDRVESAATSVYSPTADVGGEVSSMAVPCTTTEGLPSMGQAESSMMNEADDCNDHALNGSPKARVRPSLQQFVNTITPPADTPQPPWPSMPIVGIGAMHSPGTDPDISSRTQSYASSPRPTLERSQPQIQAQPQDSTSASVSRQPRIQISRSDSDNQRSSWLDEACDNMMSNLEAVHSADDPIKVLSHALPCPSSTGFAFPKIINSIHNRAPGTPTHWINVFHALPGRYSLAELPTSPPGTPGQAVGGDDYFTSKVFDSAVPILDYQEALTSLPRTPRPIVPPSSINVSIVERYIPPTNSNEFSELFQINGRSLLVDRMIELSSNHGTLCFIYPTKQGAQTFMRQYLSPILDPLLRSMCIVNELSVDLGSDLGHMAAVQEMHSFDTMARRISTLCQQLGQHRRSQYTLQYAARQEVFLDRKVWAENWWTKQEKPRVREALAKYFRMARKLPTDSEIMPTNLIHEVLDGVVSRPYGRNPEPTSGVEVGVFVISRTA